MTLHGAQGSPKPLVHGFIKCLSGNLRSGTTLSSCLLACGNSVGKALHFLAASCFSACWGPPVGGHEPRVEAHPAYIRYQESSSSRQMQMTAPFFEQAFLRFFHRPSSDQEAVGVAANKESSRGQDGHRQFASNQKSKICVLPLSQELVPVASRLCILLVWCCLVWFAFDPP